MTLLLGLLACTASTPVPASAPGAPEKSASTLLVFEETVPGYSVQAWVETDERGLWMQYKPSLVAPGQDPIEDLEVARALVLRAAPDALSAALVINHLRPSLLEERKVLHTDAQLQRSWGELQPLAPALSPDGNTLVYWSEHDPITQVTVVMQGERATLRTAP